MRLWTIGFFIAAVVQAGGQTTPGRKPSFEAVSIKRSNQRTIGLRVEGDRFVMNGLWISNAFQFAYSPCDGSPLLGSRIVGAPGWTDVDPYDIEAKADSGGKAVPLCEMRQMVQSMLEDRFQLKAHFETRELPVLNLVVVKPGKLPLSADQTPPESPVPAGRFVSNAALPRGILAQTVNGSDGSFVTGTAITIDKIISRLQGAGLETRDRQIIDKTGLTGLFDIHLFFAPENAAANAGATSGPSFFTAVQEQLGLKLEPSKAPLPVLVIESIQRPSEN